MDFQRHSVFEHQGDASPVSETDQDVSEIAGTALDSMGRRTFRLALGNGEFTTVSEQIEKLIGPDPAGANEVHKKFAHDMDNVASWHYHFTSSLQSRSLRLAIQVITTPIVYVMMGFAWARMRVGIMRVDMAQWWRYRQNQAGMQS